MTKTPKNKHATDEQDEAVEVAPTVSAEVASDARARADAIVAKLVARMKAEANDQSWTVPTWVSELRDDIENGIGAAVVIARAAAVRDPEP